MTSGDVLKIYKEFEKNRIAIWIDGGWCVDALLGEQTRKHPDLDIATERKNAARVKELLIAWGYGEVAQDDATDWNFVMEDVQNRQVDIHVFEYDGAGKNIYGIEYPFGSLTGTGTIDKHAVNCISPEWMFKFKTAYTPKEKDLKDVHALSDKFGFELPDSHRSLK